MSYDTEANDSFDLECQYYYTWAMGVTLFCGALVFFGLSGEETWTLENITVGLFAVPIISIFVMPITIPLGMLLGYLYKILERSNNSHPGRSSSPVSQPPKKHQEKAFTFMKKGMPLKYIMANTVRIQRKLNG